MEMVKRSFTVERLQPLNLCHYETIKQMKKDGYKEIIIGIGSAENSYNPRDPFTCSERIEMIHSVLKGEGFDHYFIIPIRNIGDYDLWVDHAVRLVPEFDVVYAGNPLTVELFRRAGYNVVDQKRSFFTDHSKDPPEQIDISGSTIRQMIIDDNDLWKKLVPDQVCQKILEFDGVERIKKLDSMLYQE